MSKRMLSVASFVFLCLVPGVLLGADENISSDSRSVGESVSKNIRELWHTNVQPLAGETSSSELGKAIQQVRAIKLAPKPKSTAPEVPATVDSASQNNTAEVAVEKSAAGNITPETLSRLKEVAPENFADPAELADALFTSGNLQTAAYFYRLNLKRELRPQDKAWTLFQIGNCLGDADPSGAIKAYEGLFGDFPDSHWSLLGQVKLELIDWHKANNPQAILKSVDAILKSPRDSQAKSDSATAAVQTTPNQTGSP